jgi:hypothetical protein
VRDPAGVVDLPLAYREGLPGPDGVPVQGAPMWHGHPSIDQYTGPMLAFPLVWPLLHDEGLRQRISHHLVCYLNRLQRIELVNLEANPQVMQLVTDFFAGGRLRLDPGDIDLTATDRVVAYALRGQNVSNVEQFDRSCPDHPAVLPDLVLDAGAADFFPRLYDLVLDLTEQPDKPPRPGQIDHLYVPSVRGGDASHLIHLAVLAYFFTGDPRYRTFLEEELIGRIRAPEVALTAMAFRQPDWCHPFYGDHITYGTHWQLLTLLPPSSLRAQLLQVMDEELWQKAKQTQRDAKFDVMAASLGPDLPFSALAGGEAVELLRAFGGGGDVIESPRRTYALPAGEVLARMGELGLATRCPTADERRQCEEGTTILGLQLGGESITHTCDGRPGECLLDDGLCAEPLAVAGLPPRLRQYADFLWQRNPYGIGEEGDGRKQSPGLDLSGPYWMARYYGLIQEGRGSLLAWQDAGGECGE